MFLITGEWDTGWRHRINLCNSIGVVVKTHFNPEWMPHATIKFLYRCFYLRLIFQYLFDDMFFFPNWDTCMILYVNIWSVKYCILFCYKPTNQVVFLFTNRPSACTCGWGPISDTMSSSGITSFAYPRKWGRKTFEQVAFFTEKGWILIVLNWMAIGRHSVGLFL